MHTLKHDCFASRKKTLNVNAFPSFKTAVERKQALLDDGPPMTIALDQSE